jgi:hypothetical protein
MMDLYDKAIEHYGREKQCMMTAEECAELIQALSKALRYEGESFVRQVAEEVADVEIMLEQVKRMFELSPCMVEEYKRIKLARLEWYIKQDKG